LHGCGLIFLKNRGETCLRNGYLELDILGLWLPRPKSDSLYISSCTFFAFVL
jgi:hypothetical protein